MYVFCIEGNYGIGKSTLISNMSKMEEFNKVFFMNEDFIDSYNNNIDPNGIITELNWVSSWFKRIIDHHDENIIITDRSPYSALFFTKTNHIDSFKCIIDDMINELKQYNIHIITIHIKTNREINWERILERIKKEPERMLFNECDYFKFNDVYDRYNKFKWDITVENDEKTINNVFKIVNNY